MRLNHIFLRIIDTCNLACAHCYASSSPHVTRRLSFAEMSDFIAQCGKLEVENFHLEGGEALVHPDFWRVVDLLNNVGIRPAVTSNGLILDAARIARLASRVSRLTFSVDGHCAAVHDKIRRRPGSFERATRAIMLSKAAGIHTSMISVIWRESVEHVEEIVALGERLGVDSLMLFSCGRIGAAVAHWEELRCDDESWSRYLQRARALSISRPWLSFELDRVPRSELATYLPQDYKPICCLRPRTAITIDPSGDVFPCGYFIPTGRKLGNIATHSLEELATAAQDGERLSGACKNPWKRKDGMVELCKLFSANQRNLPAFKPAEATLPAEPL